MRGDSFSRERHGASCLLTDKIGAKVFDAAKGVKVFANYAVGYDDADVRAATVRGIAVTNTPCVLTDATSDMVWALFLWVARRVAEPGPLELGDVVLRGAVEARL